MSAVDDVDQLIEQWQLAAGEFVKRKPQPVKKLWSRREDVLRTRAKHLRRRVWEKSWPARTDLIIVWSHCGVGGCSEGRGRTYHPPRLHAQGARELLDRCEDRKRQKEEPPWERSSPRLRCRWTATSPIYLTTWARSLTGPPPGTSRSLARIRIWSFASLHRALTTYARCGRTFEPR